MKSRLVFAVLAVMFLLAVSIVPAVAAVLWQEGFETYNTDSSRTWGSLDKNKSGGPNAAPNGSGNPWFGGNPDNGWVTKATENPDPVKEIVTPHSGQFMMRGNRWSTGWLNGGDNDVDFVNIAYRFNGGSAFTSNVKLDFWFYDIIGAGNANLDARWFGDYAGLENRNVPSSTDYPGTGSLNNPTAGLLAGASNDYSAGYNKNVYQVRIQGASDGYANGWFNTSINRSKGWHKASIALGQGSVSFAIDDQLTLTHAYNGAGFNTATFYTLRPQAWTWNQSAYYDDIMLQTVPEPGSMAVLGLGLVSLLGLKRRRS